MPKRLEQKLRAELARRRRQGRPVADPDAYVYGTLRKTGWTPGQRRQRAQLLAGKTVVEAGAGLFGGRYEARVYDQRGHVLAKARAHDRHEAVARARYEAEQLGYGQERRRGRLLGRTGSPAARRRGLR